MAACQNSHRKKYPKISLITAIFVPFRSIPAFIILGVPAQFCLHEFAHQPPHLSSHTERYNGSAYSMCSPPILTLFKLRCNIRVKISRKLTTKVFHVLSYPCYYIAVDVITWATA